MRSFYVLALCFALVALFCAPVSVYAAESAGPAIQTEAEIAVMKQTFYELLSVPSDADNKAIKRAFRLVSLRNHPDKAKTAADRKFRETVYPRYVLASDVLSDAKKRRSYDHLLEIGKNPQKITDYDIDNAWDEKRGIWADEANWAPLEDWHSILIVFFVTVAGFAYPVYAKFDAEKQKKLKTEKAKADSIARIQALAKQGSENFKNDKNLSKSIAQAAQNQATAKPVEKVKETTPRTESESAIRARQAEEEKNKLKQQKADEKLAKFRIGLTVIATAIKKAQAVQCPSLLAQVEEDAAQHGSDLPSALRISRAVYGTAVTNKDIAFLVNTLPGAKVEAVCSSLASNVGIPVNALTNIAQPDIAAKSDELATKIEASKLRVGLINLFIYLSQLDAKYPDPVQIGK